MALARWVRIVLAGSRTGTWAGEIWQTGFTIIGGDDSPPGAYPKVDYNLPGFEANAASNQEAWSHGTYTLGWEGTTEGTLAQQAAWASLAYGFWDTLASNYVYTTSQLDEIRISAFDGDGKAINGASIFALTTPNAGHATGTGEQPPEVAVVMSLRTGGRGPRNRGRMYLPLNGAGGTNGQIGSGIRVAVSSAGVNLADAFLDIADGWRIAVVHKAGLTYSDVTKMEVGSFFDSQRRRQTALQETYTTAYVGA